MGLTILDAGVVIGVLDASDAHSQAAAAALKAARDRGDDLAIPASAYAEVLVGPMARSKKAVETVDEFLTQLPAAIVGIDAEVAKEAARLRARHKPGLRLPDALVIATAQALGADSILTTDQGWPSRAAMRIGPSVEVVGPH